MKKLFVFVLMLCMILVVSVSAMGAVHDSNGDFASYYLASAFLGSNMFEFTSLSAASLPGHDGSGLLNLYQVKTSNWFEIDKEKPYWIVTSTSNIYDIGNQLGGEYYCDDQTFAEASYTSLSLGFISSNLSNIKGSFLTQSGFFIGMDYVSTWLLNASLISPGYRFNLNDNGYIAASLDYVSVDLFGEIVREVAGYDIDFKYYTEKMKFFGQIYKSNEIVVNGATYVEDGVFLNLGLNYQLQDDLVLGVVLGSNAEYLGWNETSYYGLGLTWTPEFMIFDGSYTVASEDGWDDQSLLELSGMFKADENVYIGLGITVDSSPWIDGTGWYLKSNINVGGGLFKMAYRPVNNHYNSLLFLSYEKEF